MMYRGLGVALLCLGLAGAVHAEGDSLLEKAHDLGVKASDAVGKGATEAEGAVVKGMDKANEKVFKPADHWIQSKVNPKGTPTPPQPQGPAANSP